MLYKKGVLKNFVKITGKYLCQRLYRRPWHDTHPVTCANQEKGGLDGQ